MGVYILIFALYMDRGGGPATAEFANRASCEKALQAAKESADPKAAFRIGICVPKNIDH